MVKEDVERDGVTVTHPRGWHHLSAELVEKLREAGKSPEEYVREWLVSEFEWVGTDEVADN